ncbi:hypothetical protein M407DRAFT_230855 [Tulasnella calospora MUT 4182]|uniref:Uncharacterized protein n=1 Tax=Tulasnella calospora MUT 4182 TaxID=1051891 RepID=A0A0C3QCB1_9AGAM|nr:hypothetical protein M407DRAFT_230855 [Tulasnella calospora MUT 4182]
MSDNGDDDDDDDDEGIYFIWLLETLGWSHIKNGRMSESMRFFRRLSKAARTRKGELEEAIGSEAMGIVLFYQNDYTKAAEFFAEARDIYARSGAHGKAAHAIQKIGYVHRDRREYLEAEKSCNEAKSLLIGIGDRQGAGLMDCEAAIVLCMKGDYDGAEAILNNAQQTFSRLGSKVGTAHVQLGLGHVHRGRSDFGKAKDLYIKSQAALIRMKHGFCAAYATRGLGHVYRLQGDLDKAEAMYKQVRAIAGEYADAEAWLGLAAIRERQGRNDEAEHFLSEASASFYKRGWQEDLPDYDSELISLYKRIKSAAESDDGA